MSREHELHAEREHLAGLYDRLDTERGRVHDEYAAALRGEDGEAPMDRDVRVRETAARKRRLDVADHGLCFGRLDDTDGGRSYVGRIGLRDRDTDEPVLIDWRAPAARPFYVATGAHPEGVHRRRQFHTRGRRLEGFTDEVLDGAGEPGSDAALLAAVNAPRGEGMRDIVATIQGEQDEIIRLDHGGVVVIEGGPGTGKTVVALHRVAYLLYTHRERIARHGVLVVGPNRAFVRHVETVLPSLGETDVVFMTPGDLVPGLHVTREDPAAAAVAKGSLSILAVLTAAIADRQRLPEEPLPIELTDATVHLGADVAGWARDEARASGLPHNEARAVFVDVVRWALTERAVSRIGRGTLTAADREPLRVDVADEVASHEELARVIDDLWPVLTPQQLLAGFYETTDDPTLHRADGGAWTVADVPLLDELVDLLGRDPEAEAAAATTRRREDQEQAEYAAGVMEVMTLDREELDEDLGVTVQDLIHADALADRFVERDTRELAERAAADRDWTYRHVVVDEAQELSAMDWRVLMRRCPSRSFTVVGDLAQRRAPAGARSWGAMLDPYVPGRWVYRALTVNYRTPAEIMAVAAEVLAGFAPEVVPPESVRASGVEPWARPIGDLAEQVAAFRTDEADREGTSVVIGPPGVPGTVPASETKGLEFDAVLVVDPDRVLAESPADLYVALTRATQRLGVLYRGVRPAYLSRADASTTASATSPATGARTVQGARSR
ncbi:RNA polymerase recycling motor ATPase HelR [Actinomycetospora termitidis]|uniref:RNA polymerase recycling motor ATPase HelR n=1 Tax=Actinomycetospora termitidis TaxID=3053470 RepID=A0ABT7M5R8_9PSEU|nr:RNA polymerase recycling motor ATPase HelR [Actinomycetospora sp. Odt1-22]MDL5156015.1 RNA polymerase recycling motor ATPase HelR [Actinomycetospora sp. Odt1-22]